MNLEQIEDQVHDLIDRNQKIEAIKLVRRTTGWGLKRAKDYVDDLASAAQPALGPAEATALEQKARAWVQQDGPLEAIKRLRERTGWGLRECKAYVDVLRYGKDEAAHWTAITSNVSTLLAQGGRDEAVEWVTANTEMSAHEAREYVDFMAASARPRFRTRKRKLPEQAVCQVRELLSQGHKVEAIRLVRTLTRWSLRDSKEYVDSLA